MSYSIESFLAPGICEDVIEAVNAFVDRAYTPEACRTRKAYVYEYAVGAEAFAFAVHCPGSPETRHLPGFALDELPDPLPDIFRRVCRRMGLVRGRVLFNVARYPEDCPALPAHFDGELFEFEVLPEGRGSVTHSGLRPREVGLVTLRNESEACGTTLHAADGSITPTRARVGELLRFDNVHQRWIRFVIGWRALEQDCADWCDARPLRAVSIEEAVAIEERFLEQTWPGLVDETLARAHFPFRSDHV